MAGRESLEDLNIAATNGGRTNKVDSGVDHPGVAGYDVGVARGGWPKLAQHRSGMCKEEGGVLAGKAQLLWMRAREARERSCPHIFHPDLGMSANWRRLSGAGEVRI
ncbi:hypothetical protein SAY87_010457 [Trapa incisa]|uniref:Uncharacterized protein n=1 Tax=Trapa incisa TaxID=236973 RepID=A0AAN7JI55_9MYRT|nr:hypothetical protein SAY87_010457 [Trapa incisa]